MDPFVGPSQGSSAISAHFQHPYVPDDLQQLYASSSPVYNLRILLDALFLPASLIYAGSVSSSSHSISGMTAGQIAECDLVQSDVLPEAVHRILVQQASILAPARRPTTGVIYPSIDDTLSIARVLADACRDAHEVRNNQKMSGEIGATAFIETYLCTPLNRWIRRMIMLRPSCQLYWRMVGKGPGGQPDIELVFQDGLVDRVFAVIEIKTESALTDHAIQSMPGLVFDHLVYMDNDEKRVKYRASIYHPASSQTNLAKVVTQSLAELYTRRADYAIITNYNQLVLLHRGLRSGQSSDQILVSNAFATNARRLPNNLAPGAPSLLLGVSLLALKEASDREEVEGRERLWLNEVVEQGEGQSAPQYETRSLETAARLQSAANRQGGIGEGAGAAHRQLHSASSFPCRDMATKRLSSPPITPPKPQQIPALHSVPSQTCFTNDSREPSLLPGSAKLSMHSNYLLTPETSPTEPVKQLPEELGTAMLRLSVSPDFILSKSVRTPLDPSTSLTLTRLNCPLRPLLHRTSTNSASDFDHLASNVSPTSNSTSAANYTTLVTSLHLPIDLTINSYLSSGSLWDVYAAAVSPQATSTFSPTHIVKFCSPTTFPPDDTNLDESPEEFTDLSSCQAIIHENAILSGPLAPLSGVAVPRYGGLWVTSVPRQGQSQIWCMIQEFSGRAIPQAELMQTQYRSIVTRLYRALHDRGVLHGDVASRHILRNGDDIRLIDFDRAMLRETGETDAAWTRRCEVEMTEVDAMLKGW